LTWNECWIVNKSYFSVVIFHFSFSILKKGRPVFGFQNGKWKMTNEK